MPGDFPSDVRPPTAARCDAAGPARRLADRLLKLRVVRFALVGGTATGVHVGTTIMLVDGLGMGSAALATVLGTLAGIATSYLGNWAWAFEAKGAHGHYLPRFLASYALVMGLNGAIMYVAADRLGVPYLLPLFATLVISPVLTFLLNQHFVFAPRWQT
jgi:putative flippase GtrA